jgi:DHA1 family bicyclomycin/chloramphenicol resistance-like MFS transporter
MFSFVFAINGFGLIIATQVTGRLAGKIKEATLLMYGLLQAAVGSVLLVAVIATHMSVILVCILLFFVVSSVGIVNTTVFSLAMENQASNAGSASALLGLLPFLLGAAVAPLVGLGGGQNALPMGIVIMVCDLLALGVYMTLVRRKTAS